MVRLRLRRFCDFWKPLETAESCCPTGGRLARKAVRSHASAVSRKLQSDVATSDTEHMESLVRAFASAMDAGPAFPWWIAWIALVGLFVTAIHEAGHLIVALWTGQQDVALRIGSFGELIEERLGAVRLQIGVLDAPWRPGGAVSFDAAHTTAKQMMAIALAGPAASLAGAVFTALAAASFSTQAVSDFFAAATVAALVTAILNLIPLTLTEGTRRRPGARLSTDGRHALDALHVVLDVRR